MKFARIQNNVVAEFLVPIAGFQLNDCFHADIIAQCESVNDDVQLNWVKQEDGSFSAPIDTSTPPAEPAV